MRPRILKKGFAPIVVILMIVALLGGTSYVYKKLQGSGTPQKMIPTDTNVPKDNLVTSNYDVSGGWDYGSKISGVSKSGAMNFTDKEVRFDMMATRYSLSGDEIKFDVYGGFSYVGKVSAPDFMSGTVAKDGKEVGTWSAKRPGGAGAPALGGTGGASTSGTEGSIKNIDVSGNWEFNLKSMVAESTIIILFEGEESSGVYTDGSSFFGKYSVIGNEIILTSPTGGIHKGKVNSQGDMEGDIISSSGTKVGIWSAKRREDIKIDVRDEWKFTTVSDLPKNAKPVTTNVIFGSMPTQNTYRSSMTKGKMTFEGDKTVWEYSINWPGGEITITKYNGDLKFTGNVSQEGMIGSYSGQFSSGKWHAERGN